jgi:hypothetical protein
MKTLGLNILLFLLILLFGCDARQEVKGIVVDINTRKPLNKVEICRYSGEDHRDTNLFKTYSDSAGKFYYSTMGFSNSFKLSFYKDHYEMAEVKYEYWKKADTVFMRWDGKDDAVSSLYIIALDEKTHQPLRQVTIGCSPLLLTDHIFIHSDTTNVVGKYYCEIWNMPDSIDIYLSKSNYLPEKIRFDGNKIVVRGDTAIFDTTLFMAHVK